MTRTVYNVSFTCLVEDSLTTVCYRQRQVVADDIGHAVRVMKAWARQEDLRELDILAVWYNHKTTEEGALAYK